MFLKTKAELYRCHPLYQNYQNTLANVKQRSYEKNEFLKQFQNFTLDGFGHKVNLDG